jgi:hypothetical protein
MPQIGFEGTFKAIVGAKWGVVSSGLIDAPTGHFTVVEIPKHEGERAEMREAVFENEDAGTFDDIEAGWYFAIEFPPDTLTYEKCKNRDYAFARFSLARSAYEEWEDSQLG